MANAMMVIYPYCEQYTWVFDDERVGLVREPFVQGVPEMINVLVADIPNAAQGFRLLFFCQSISRISSRNAVVERRIRR